MPLSTWDNEEKVALLKKLWAEGLTCSQIAAKIGGVTRCAIIGKVHRLKLNGRDYSNGPVRPQLSPEEHKRLKNERQNRRNENERVRRRVKLHLFNAAEERRRERSRKEARTIMRQNGAPSTSAQYRKHLPKIGEMTRSEMRSMLTIAVQNTAAMEIIR